MNGRRRKVPRPIKMAGRGHGGEENCERKWGGGGIVMVEMVECVWMSSARGEDWSCCLFQGYCKMAQMSCKGSRK